MIAATDRPSAIPGYADWPSYFKAHPRYPAHAAPAQQLADALGVPGLLETPEVTLEDEITLDGVTSSRLSWQLGFGPRTFAWFVRPAGATKPLPGVLALHCHAGIKSTGADRLVDHRLLNYSLQGAAERSAAERAAAERDPAERAPAEGEPAGQNPTAEDSTARILAAQATLYGGRPLATWLASRGFAVLAHDAFCWGSRRFDLDTPPFRTADALKARMALWREAGVEPSGPDVYDAAAAAHEDTVAKAAGLLGTSLAGTVAHDDLAALGVLASLPGVDADRLGCLGFSGGGGRSVILAALSPLIRSHVVTCMMATFESLVPAHLDAHSWLLQTPGLSRLGEWPELTSRSEAKSMLVQYALADELFPKRGMLDADDILRGLHSAGRYTGSFWPGGHTFTTAMQDEAAAFLSRALAVEPEAELAAGQRAAERREEPEVEPIGHPDSVPAMPRVALVGVHGYGARHLGNLERLRGVGAVELVAVADPRPPDAGVLGGSVQVFATLDELLAAGTAPDVVILATPIQTHAPLALAAIAAGADVYVEKPPVASMAQFAEVLSAAEKAGRLVQVGFQSLGSYGLPAIAEVLASGEIGEVRGVSATGTWVRTRGYFKRSRWAGKRSLDGTDVVDGVATNALAHAVATGLRIAGATRVEDIASVETDLYRAHATESDDTSVIRVRTAQGKILSCALTLCAPAQSAPSVTVYGTLGRAEFFYTEDRLVVTTSDGERSRVFDRVDLLENLLEVRTLREAGREGDSNTDDAAGLLSSLASAGAYTAVLEAIRTAEPPQEIGQAHVSWQGDGDDAHPIVHGIDQLVRRAALSHATFAELGAPWARQPADRADSTPADRAGSTAADAAPFQLGNRPVAVWRDGRSISPTSSPRPYLHPVTTLAGTVVTDHVPEDHVWHLGAGVAIQDVDGVNFWGGRTYTRHAGAYVWLPDHGRIECVSAEQADGRRIEGLHWLGPSGEPILHEQRNWSWSLAGPSAWQLSLDFELTPAGPEPVRLGSPGSNGRPQGGYGGFFWRLPSVAASSVWTPEAEGEDAVHGTVAPWLAWSGDFGFPDPGLQGTVGAAAGSGPATLVFLAAPQAPDPWFVRMSGYPGVGLSLAWDTPAVASHRHPLRRTVTVIIADGLLATKDIELLITLLGETA